MQPHLEIEFGHLPHDSQAEAAAREGVALLQQTCADIGACHVSLAGPADGHHLCQSVCVKIRVQVPGTTLSVSRMQEGGDAAEATVRQAFGAAQRRLLEWMKANAGAAATEYC